MAVLNVTSDSFFDGGKFLSLDKAYEQAAKLIAQGADIIDIGGESTRPGATKIPLDLELARVIPLIERIRNTSDICISIDTYKPEVMEAAVRAGANIINDIYALRQEGALSMAAMLAVPVCLMHMQGEPQTMQNQPDYPRGLIVEVNDFFAERINACIQAGINKELLLLDPGFGFGKQVQDNLDLVRQLNDFRVWDIPLLLGLSRKSSIGALLNKEKDERLIGSVTLATYAALQGVSILRSHDVEELNQALSILDALLN